VSDTWFERHPRKTLLLFMIFLFIVLVCASEIILRMIADTTPEVDERAIRLRETYHPYSKEYTPDPFMVRFSDGLEKKAYLLQSDDDGFIIPSRIHEDADLNIFFLGGSTTECMWVDEKDRFPYLAGRLLEAKTKRKTNSYNAGHGGNNSLHSINNLVNKILPLSPDIVVLMHNINDLNVLMYEKTFWNENPGKSPIIITRSKKRPVYDFLKAIKNLLFPELYKRIKALPQALMKSIGGDSGEDEISEMVHREFQPPAEENVEIDAERMKEQFRKNLVLFVNVCRSYDVTPVLMTQASRIKDHPDQKISDSIHVVEKDFGISYDDYREYYDLFNETIREVAETENVYLIDLDKSIPKERTYMYDPIHFNEQGSRRAAQVIAEGLEEVIKTPAPSPRP